MKDVVVVKDLVKRYTKAKEDAVSHISFSVPEGGFFAFLGPNGAGKTTTISILTTTLQKTSGEVQIAGFDLDKNQSEVRQQIGVIFQNPSLDQNLSAEHNVRLHVMLYGMYPYVPFYKLMPRSYKDKIHELTELLGIEKELHKPIKSFSGGMKRKLEIVRSLMHEPKVLFLDEPTTGLDPASRRALWDYLQHVRKEKGTTIFLTTHYLDEAEGADQVVVIKSGQIIKQGSPSQIKNSLLQEFILLDSLDKQTLGKELSKLGVKVEGSGPFKISFDNVEISPTAEKVHKILAQIKAPLSLFETHLPTLEQAYLELIKDTNET